MALANRRPMRSGSIWQRSDGRWTAAISLGNRQTRVAYAWSRAEAVCPTTARRTRSATELWIRPSIRRGRMVSGHIPLGSQPNGLLVVDDRLWVTESGSGNLDELTYG